MSSVLTDPGSDPRVPPPSRAGSTILLVDDDPDCRTSFAEFLRLDGHTVLEAATGGAALETLEVVAHRRAPRPDLLVVDLLMPNINGVELVQRLRRSPRWAEIPILVVTGINDPMLAVRLDVPFAFKGDAEALRAAVRRRLAPA
jgi:CheY-like chemotaxis protein